MITTTDTLQALTDAFNASGIDTQQKVQAFVQFQVAQLTQDRVTANANAQAAVEAKQAEVTETDALISQVIAQQAS